MVWFSGRRRVFFEEEVPSPLLVAVSWPLSHGAQPVSSNNLCSIYTDTVIIDRLLCCDVSDHTVSLTFLYPRHEASSGAKMGRQDCYLWLSRWHNDVEFPPSQGDHQWGEYSHTQADNDEHTHTHTHHIIGLGLLILHWAWCVFLPPVLGRRTLHLRQSHAQQPLPGEWVWQLQRPHLGPKKQEHNQDIPSTLLPESADSASCY